MTDTTLLDFDAMMHGDETVDKYDLFRRIDAGLDRRDREYFGAPLRWQARMLQIWHRQFIGGHSSEPLSDHDTRQRVLILLSSDLFPFEARNEARFKATLLKNHKHLLGSQNLLIP